MFVGDQEMYLYNPGITLLPSFFEKEVMSLRLMTPTKFTCFPSALAIIDTVSRPVEAVLIGTLKRACLMLKTFSMPNLAITELDFVPTALLLLTVLSTVLASCNVRCAIVIFR